MKKSVKPQRKSRTKRKLFEEIKERFNALAEARAGKRSLRTHSIQIPLTSTKVVQKLANANTGNS